MLLNQIVQVNVWRFLILQNKINAAAFIIWDKKKTYYLVGGAYLLLRNNGAGSLLIWKMIEFSQRHSKYFDFEGSMIEPIEKHFRAFGGKKEFINKIYKHSFLVKQLISLNLINI